jgi:hypothetical protein
MTDGRSWLPLHIALALGDTVKEEDVHSLSLHSPLEMQRYSSNPSQGNVEIGY